LIIGDRFLASSFANTPTVGAVAVIFFMYILSSLYQLGTSYVASMALAIISPAAFCIGLRTQLAYNSQQIAFSWTQLMLTDSVTGVSPAAMLAFLIFDTVLYFAIGLYVTQLHPGPFATPRPWNFLFTRAWWSPASVAERKPLILSSTGGSKAAHKHVVLAEHSNDAATAAIRIRNLTKTFDTGVTAVDDLSLVSRVLFVVVSVCLSVCLS
jgi:ATP-binding cassette subfamily A (ABC1) protein 3